jgi:hypothetical protein
LGAAIPYSSPAAQRQHPYHAAAGLGQMPRAPSEGRAPLGRRAAQRSSGAEPCETRAHRRTTGWNLANLQAIVVSMPTAVATYPDYQEQVEKLVRQHRKLRGEHLHLAVYLAPPKRPKRDIYLFELIDDFGGGHIDPDKQLFTFAYGSTPGLPLPHGVNLWMILTNPTELDQAIRENWKRLDEIRNAKKAGRTTILHDDAMGRKFWNKIR